MLTVSNKLFVQLEPDAAAKASLRDLQTKLDDSGRLITQRSMHLSVIHIGKISKLLDTLRPSSAMSDKQLISMLDNLAHELQKITAKFTSIFQLQPTGYDMFGANKSTFVVLFRPTDELQDLHRQSLERLQTFLANTGVSDVEAFMKHDDNLRYALTLAPHVALAQSYRGRLIDLPLQELAFSMMPIVYEH